MNPNDILQQQQAMLDQMMHRSDQYNLMAIIVWLVLVGISAWVVYMFYRCQRDAADELRKIRVAYQFEIDRRARANEKSTASPVHSAGPDNPPVASPADDKYKPRE
jgi:hypothetical protein